MSLIIGVAALLLAFMSQVAMVPVVNLKKPELTGALLALAAVITAFISGYLA